MSLMCAIHQQASQVGLTTIGEETVHFPLHHDMTQAAGIRQHLTQIQPAGERSFAVQLKEASLKFGGDRKSTRLNSSHVAISYAVFCLKKKTTCTTDGRANTSQTSGWV